MEQEYHEIYGWLPKSAINYIPESERRKAFAAWVTKSPNPAGRYIVDVVVKSLGDDFLKYVKKLEEKKPVIYCGDLNVAHKEIDLKNPSSNHRNAGFTDEERGKMDNVLSAGLIDTYRFFNPDKKDIYSWWSYRFHAREKNAGWRIDYFICSESLKDKLISADIHTEIYGSDHCPVELQIDL